MRVLYVDEWSFYALRSRTTLLVLGLLCLAMFLSFWYSLVPEYPESVVGFAIILTDILGFSFCVSLFFSLLWKVRHFGANLVYLRIGFLLVIIYAVLNGLSIWYTYYMSTCGAIFSRILYVKVALLAMILSIVSAPTFLFLKVALDFDLILKGKINNIPTFFDKITLHVECSDSDGSCIVSLNKRLLYVSLILVIITVGYSSWYIISSIFVDLFSLLGLLFALYLKLLASLARCLTAL